MRPAFPAFFAALALALLAGGCALTPLADVLAELAPGGMLRVAINYGNPVLATRDAKTGAPQGVSVDIAREAARRLGVPLAAITFTSAAQVVESLKAGHVDMAFMAIDPARAADAGFTPPYVVIEGAWLVRKDSPIRRNEDVDRLGHRIAVGRGSVYELHLRRTLKAATLVPAPSSPVVTDFLLAQGLEVAAGVKPQLQADAKSLPGLRVLDGNFIVIQQALAVPAGKRVAQAWLGDLVEELKRTGFVQATLERHEIEGALVAPLGAAR